MLTAVFLVILSTYVTAQLQECKPHREIFCGEEKHVLSKSDCDRGLVWQYCTMTLKRIHPEEGYLSRSVIDWERSEPWRLILSSTPILTLPCLSMDVSSLTLVCHEERCDNATLTEDIEVCIDRHSRGLVHTIERHYAEEKVTSSTVNPDSNHQFDIRVIAALVLLALLIILFLLSLQLVKTCKNGSTLEKLHREMCLNAALPTISHRRADDENDYEALPINIGSDRRQRSISSNS